MRPPGTAAELQRRRERAVALLEQGEDAATVARILGVHRSTLSRWRTRARTPGGLAARPHPGRPPRLTIDQLARLEALLLRGADEHGWPNQLWTAPRVAALIRRQFGVAFHPEHVRKLLKQRLGWTSQKPRRRARERNDREAERWKADEFPRIVREAWRRSAYLVFLDESGFQLTPTVRRTLAPRGGAPVVDGWDRRDKISAISCITLSPRRARPNLFFELLPDNANVRAADVVRYLQALRRQLPGAWTVVWDRSNLHSRSRLVRAWLARHPEVVAEDFPGYFPELNPDEGVWGWTKYGRLANLAAEDTGVLRGHVAEELGYLKRAPRLLRSFVNHANLPLRL
jgi:transposase